MIATGRPRTSPQRLDDALTRALAVFRVATLAYALVSIAVHLDGYADREAAVIVAVVMVAWTVALVLIRRPSRGLLVADLAVAVTCQQLSVLALSAAQVDRGDPTLTVSWVAVPVAAWAVAAGYRGGAAAALVVSIGTVVERGGASQATVNSCVLLVLLGTVVGYLVAIARRAEQAYADAVALQASGVERDRLARHVHDGVLQVLALVARRSTDPELATLAAGQERQLRSLVATAAVVPTGTADLRELLPVRTGVELALPAEAVVLPTGVATELAAAIEEAVNNALQHGGTTAWLLLEDNDSEVIVSIRDDGPGITPERLRQAAEQGRMGVSGSIRGRVAALGGTVEIVSTPGQGTEVEICVPR